MSRATSRASSVAEASATTAASYAALLGATTAFTRPPLHARTSSAASYRSVGAASSAAGLDSFRPRSPGPVRGKTQARDNDVPRLDTARLQPPAELSRRQTRSPSQQAALAAASRAPLASMNGTSNVEARQWAKVSRPSAPPKPRRLSGQVGNAGREEDEKTTDDTPIPSTPSLVDLFERKASDAKVPSARRPPPEPIVIAPSPELSLQSPKPVRETSGITTLFRMELDGVDEQVGDVSPPPRKPSEVPSSIKSPASISPPKNDRMTKGEPTAWDPNTRTFKPQSEVRQFQREMSAAAKVDEVLSFDGQSPSHQDHHPLVVPRTRAGSRNSVSSTLHSPLYSPTLPINKPRANSSSLKAHNVDPIKVQRSGQPGLAPAHSPSSFQSAASVTAQYHQLYTRKLTPSMTGDQLANAMVASSLASSRTNSPWSHTGLEPPPPPSRRHKVVSKMPFSRTPSPAARTGMLHTLRKEDSDSSDEEDDNHPYHKHKKDKHRIVRKHPHKHHEGDRRRWREAVTERERKRYEGVWAANKGLHYSLTTEEQRFCRKKPNSPEVVELSLAVQEQVSNLTARDIWARSRLPNDTLAMVWDLVDSDSVGRLSKAEFVVGLWLIDQRLKGRKLPVKVSDSVWASVRGFPGMKTRKSIR